MSSSSFSLLGGILTASPCHWWTQNFKLAYEKQAKTWQNLVQFDQADHICSILNITVAERPFLKLSFQNTVVFFLEEIPRNFLSNYANVTLEVALWSTSGIVRVR
jgi:hypothetical protein